MDQNDRLTATELNGTPTCDLQADAPPLYIYAAHVGDASASAS
jgi:hypothetical protein